MRIFILILVILLILGVLESQAIIPQSPYSILGTLNSAAVFIRSLNIQSYYLIIPNIVITPKGILSTLLILFIIGYLYERFRELEQNNLILKKQIHKLTTDIMSTKSVDNNDNHQSNKESDMREIAHEIRNFLSTLAESVTINPSTPIRTKKIRRVQSENLSDSSESSEAEIISQASDAQSTSKVDAEPHIDSNISNIGELNKAEVEQSQDDDNLSNIDLARALIESGETEKAKEIIVNVIKTGTSDEAHEAKLLNLQIS
tara:strand:+ start:25 stop:804 length:780 start_codon:yes stop_codon:yes gene_type:complete